MFVAADRCPVFVAADRCPVFRRGRLVKEVTDAGYFEGYASVYNNVDLGDDVIVPGAFVKVKTTRAGKLKLALFHDLTRLIGAGDFESDDHGLFIKGQINPRVSYARDALELMKDGTLDSMSIGFNTCRQHRGARRAPRADHQAG
ncbi:HK97 family phage prohead protease [Pseudomonas oryzihabitans]|uniref:HK97 family phage prohead protease n=1 Tax=Pseudomonas oryzihabitans TaxID=47885 RepID=UPI003F59BDD2